VYIFVAQRRYDTLAVIQASHFQVSISLKLVRLLDRESAPLSLLRMALSANSRNLYKLLTSDMHTAALIFTVLLSTSVSALAQGPTTGYAPVNGLEMYYEMHGSGSGSGSSAPLVLLHGSFMTISNNWTEWIGEFSKIRKVIAVEMQGHGRTADIDRDFSYENLADDIAAMLDFLEIEQADLLGYSMGGGVAMQVAIRHPEKVRKVVSISAVSRHDGWVEEAVATFPELTADILKGSPIETEYKELSPTPNEFPNFVKRVISMDLKPYDFGADKLKATRAPFLFIHGDADGVRLDHISEMFRLKGDEIFGDMRPRSQSRLAVLPNTTHITLMEKGDAIIPMVNDFLDAKPQKE
jgi:pimeloyl-ACP methyl ester carboxylesterase